MKNKIAELRNKQNPKMSQEKLAQIVGISRPYLSEIERNCIESPGGKIMLAIAKALRCKISDIFLD